MADLAGFSSISARTDDEQGANKSEFADHKLSNRTSDHRKALGCEMGDTMVALFGHLPPKKRAAVFGEVAAGTVYFVGPEGGPIKIGYASRLEYRLKDLRTMNAFPLIVHATVQGVPSDERAYHRKFKEHRLHGEWFSPHPDILAEIGRLRGETI